MSYYFIANIKILDPLVYGKYLEKADAIFSRYKGKYLVVDNKPEILEGSWDYTRNVMIQFDSRKDFDNWYFSPEYQEILRFRKEGAQCDTILVEGK